MKMDDIGKSYDRKKIITQTQKSAPHPESRVKVGNYGRFSGGNVSDATCKKGA